MLFIISHLLCGSSLNVPIVKRCTDRPRSLDCPSLSMRSWNMAVCQQPVSVWVSGCQRSHSRHAGVLMGCLHSTLMPDWVSQGTHLAMLDSDWSSQRTDFNFAVKQEEQLHPKGVLSWLSKYTHTHTHTHTHTLPDIARETPGFWSGRGEPLHRPPGLFGISCLK